MSTKTLLVLRIGLAVTFFWIGVLIWTNPAEWAVFIQPWAVRLIPGSVILAMQQTAVLDMAVGLLLLSPLAWIGALLGAVHLVIVLVTSGINEVTIRDVGLLAATVALSLETIPDWIWAKIRSLKK